MRLNQTVAFMAVLALAGPACKHGPKDKGVVPFPSPKPSASAPVVPNNPTPAPPPTGDGRPVPPVDDYERIRQMDLTEIDKAGILQDVYFDYDRAELRETDRATLTRDGAAMKKYDYLIVTIEGHADERGTIEYNLALSDRRARVVYDYLGSIGVPASRIKAVAYGKEIPVCTQSNEDCWQRNRRAHLTVTGKTAR